MLTNGLKQGFGLAVGYVIGLAVTKSVADMILKSVKTLENKN